MSTCALLRQIVRLAFLYTLLTVHPVFWKLFLFSNFSAVVGAAAVITVAMIGGIVSYRISKNEDEFFIDGDKQNVNNIKKREQVYYRFP